MSKESRDLFGAKSEPRYYTFDTDQLTLVTDKKHPLYDPRVEEPVDETLVASILLQGQLDPVKIWRDPDTGKIYVVDGRRRFRAIIAANVILKKKGMELLRVAAIPKRGQSFELVGIMIAQNFVRRNETPIEKAKKTYDYVTKLGRSKQEAATIAGVSVATIDNFLNLLDGVPELVAAVEQKKIAASAAYKIAQLSPGRQKTTVEKLLKVAPRVPGKKRSPNGAKARAIVQEGTGTVRPRAEVEAMGKKLAGMAMTPEIKGALGMLDWVLGDEGGLEGIVEKGES